MVTDAKAGKLSSIVFSLSSHGTQMNDTSGDEPEGKDEAFVPHDIAEKSGAWDTAHIISDDELHGIEDHVKRAGGSPVLIEGNYNTGVFQAKPSGVGEYRGLLPRYRALIGVGDLAGRVSGPMKFRLVLQPTMAAIFAIRAGLADARAGRTPYFWTLISEPSQRAYLIKDGWKGVGKVFVLALVLDVVYQIVVSRFVYPGETIIVAFVLARPLHLEPATIALAGAAVLMFLDNWQHHNEKQSENVHKTFSDVEWITIFFFVGLFVVVHGVEVGGLLGVFANKLVEATGGQLASAGFVILWASAVLSAIIDNIPFVATMIPLIKSMAPAYGGPDAIMPLWWCLSLGACLGGNGTLIGASANLTVAGIAERNGVPFRFLTYTLYAMPMMIVSIAISHVYVWWRYF
jgi:hypothetical protein